jgi:quinol monooxygenase YgiN
MSHGGVLLVAQLHAQVGRLAELKELLADLATSARDDPGCRSYHVAFMAEPGECLVVATWDSEAALRAHYRTDAYLRYRSRVGELLTRPSDVVVHHVSASVHARDPNPPDPSLLG